MRKYIITIILSLVSNFLWPQCASNNTHTDPNPVYVQPSLQTGADAFKSNTFQWWGDNNNAIGPINKPISNLSAYVTSPYYASIISWLAELVDNKIFESSPQAGWELIKADLGYFNYYDPIAHTNSIYMFNSTNGGNTPVYSNSPIPYYILYNKYSAILRVFFLRNDAMASYPTVQVQLTFDNDATTGYTNTSALFNAHNAIEQPIDQKINNTEIDAIAICPTDPDNWAFADFQMSYDPCTCHWPSAINIGFNAQEQGSISFTSHGIGHAVPYNGDPSVFDTLNGSVSPYSPNYLASFLPPNSDGVAQQIVQEYWNANGIALDATSPNNIVNILTGISKVIKPTEDIAGMGEGDDGGGFGNPVSDAFDFFSWTAGVNDAQGSAMVLSTEEVGNGDLLVNRGHSDASMIIANPGSAGADAAPQYTSLNVNTAQTPEYPMYNNVMGLIALKNTPTVNAFQYNPQTGNGGVAQSNHYEFNFDGNTFNYVLNPLINAANTKIFAAIDYFIPMTGALDNDDGVTSFDPSALYNMSIIDESADEQTKHFRTASFPIECLPQVISMIDFAPLNIGDDIQNTVKANIVLDIYYEFNPDEYNNVHRSFQMMKFPLNFNLLQVDAQNPPCGQSNPNTYWGCDERVVDLAWLPTDLFLHQTVFSGVISHPIYSYGTITIDGDITNTTGQPIRIIAQNEIDVKPGATVGADIILEINPYPPLCEGLSSIPPSTVDATFCNSSNYKANQSNASKTNFSDYNTIPVQRPFHLNLYPNPATSECTIRFDMPADADVTITLSDMTGREVGTIDHSRHAQGTSFVPFSTTAYTPGIYFVRFTDGTNMSTQKLTISGGL